MATIIKRNGRKLLDSGKPTVHSVDANYQGLAERQHFEMVIGDHIIRIERTAGEKLGLRWCLP